MALDLPGGTVAVTGGAGFLGQAFLARLAAEEERMSRFCVGATTTSFMSQMASG